MTRKVLAAFIVMLMAAAASAQPGRPRPEDLSDEEFVSMQARDMARWLRLEQGSATDKFIDTYSAFRREINALALKTKPGRMAGPGEETESEEDIDKSILQNFEVSGKILEIRRKYYTVFKGFLKPSQIRRMYRFESDAGRRMHEDADNPGRHGNPGRPGSHGPGSPDGGQSPMGPPPQFGQAE